VNPFVLFFKPLFTAFTWILTGFVAIIMALGGKFDGQPRTDGQPALVAFVTPAVGARPATLEIRVGDSERFVMAITDDPSAAISVPDEILEVLGDPPRESVSTLVRLYSNYDRQMVCRLSYDPIDKEPAGVCAIDTELVYDILFVDRSAVVDDDRPPI